MDVKQLFFGGGRGCVHPDTLLDTPHGKVKIKDWKGGPIYSYKDGEVIVTYATPSIKGTEEDLYEVILSNGLKVTCTDEHKFRTFYGWKMLKDIDQSDSYVLTRCEQYDFCQFHYVKSIEHFGRLHYWDLHVPETNCYFAQGILHHNSGKTSWMIGTAFTQWAMYGKSARCLILRRQFRDLKEIIRQGKEILVDKGVAKYNGGDYTFHGLGKFRGCSIELGNLDSQDDYGRYHGNAYSMVGFDEITEFKSWDLVDRMGSTCRSKDPNVIPIMRFTGNPGGRLHQEVKRRFYDPAPKGRRLLKTKDKILPNGRVVTGQTRMMVSSTVQDNPYLWDNDPDYVTWLLSLPDELRKAWFEGCWDIAIGSFFGDVWNARDHVIRKVRPIDVPADWEIRRAFDWGSSTPFCHLWYTISNGDPLRDGRQFPRGAIIVLWEFYGQDPDGGLNKGMRWSSTRVAQELAQWEVDHGVDGRVIAGPADNQIYANTDGKDSNIYINFEREGILFTRSNKSPGSAKVGWEQIRTRLVGRDERPLFYFTEDCPNCIRTIPELAKHPTKLDDIDDNQEDHCADVAKYIALHHPIDIHHSFGHDGLGASPPTRL